MRGFDLPSPVKNMNNNIQMLNARVESERKIAEEKA